MRLWSLALLLAGCPAHKIPDHLRPPEPKAETQQAEITTVPELVAAWVSADPLARREPGPDPTQVASLEGGAPYAELLRASKTLTDSEAASVRTLEGLEQEHRGTAVVALSRGARLRVTQSLLADGGGGAQGRLLAMLSPQAQPQKTETLPLGAMAWLAEPKDLRDRGLLYGDRWVLAGWLDGPEVELAAVAAGLGTSPFDHVRATPLGRLVLARAEGKTSDALRAHGDLERATIYALHSATADSNKEQRKLKATRDAMLEELGEHPNHVLLTRAAEGLLQDAGNDRSAGAALLALAAVRLHRACEDEPCIGLDRVQNIAASGRWHADVQRLALLWQIAALKDALDGMDTARETVRAHQATVDLVDALNGTGHPPLDGGLLMRRRPDEQTWLVLGRALGQEQLTTWESVRPALEALLHSLAEQALKNEKNAEVRALLQRI